MYTCINTYNVLARVIWPATFARSAGPPGGGRTYNIIGRAGASPPSRTAAIIFLYMYIYLFIYFRSYVVP